MWEDDEHPMPKEVFLEVLGDIWQLSDDIGWYRQEMELDSRVESALQSQVTPGTQRVPLMMEPDERAALADLPERVTIYRGCGPGNRRGLSWTLSREVAGLAFLRAVSPKAKLKATP